MVPSARLALTSKVADLQERIHNVEAIEEKKQKVEKRWSTYKRRISTAYNRRVKSRPLKVGDLVLKAAGDIQKDANALKFAPKWEWPYIIQESYDSGYFLISRLNSEGYLTPINEKWVKLYFL